MFRPIKVIDVELSRPIPNFEGLEQYETLQALIRLHGTPLGYVYLPLPEGRCSAAMLSQIITEQYSWSILRHLMSAGLAAPSQPHGLRIAELVNIPPPVYDSPFPLVTVAVCTRDRTADLAICLEALCQLDYPNLDFLVIDNAPSNDANERLVRENYSNVRYICEPRPGVSWARNRAIIEARGEIIACADDDVVVDPGWVRALAQVFADNREVMAVTGLIVPYELETDSQILFERHGGFGRGFERKSWRVLEQKMPWQMLGAGEYGTGANMAFRRRLFEQIGLFNPALGVGTVTNGCEDHEMFFRVLHGGHTLVYEPSALVRHRHRRNYAQLRSQLANDGIGLNSYFVYGTMTYPELRLSFLWQAIWWFVYGNVRRLWMSLKHPTRFPRDLVLAELYGCIIGLTRYPKARRIASEIENTFGALPQPELTEQPVSGEITPKRSGAVAVRTVELTQPLQALTDVKDYTDIRVFVTCKDRLLGYVDLTNPDEDIPVSRLREAIIDGLGMKLIEPDYDLNMAFRWAETVSTVSKHYSQDEVV